MNAELPFLNLLQMLGKNSNLPTFVLTEAQQYVFNFISEPQVFLFTHFLFYLFLNT